VQQSHLANKRNENGVGRKVSDLGFGQFLGVCLRLDSRSQDHDQHFKCWNINALSGSNRKSRGIALAFRREASVISDCKGSKQDLTQEDHPKTLFGAWVHALRVLFRRYILPHENATLLTLSVSVGLTAGIGVWLFRQGIDLFTQYYQEALEFGVLSGIGKFALIPILGLAGLIVGFLMDRMVGEERHHGVAGIIEAMTLAGGRLPVSKMPIKAALASFSIGAGASVGPEDPSVQIGANLGSLFGQWLHMSDDRVRLLVAAGAASGIAAAFHAPIAGVFFALEAILGDFSTSSFGVVVLAAVVSSVLTRAIDPGGAELGSWSYSLGNFQEIPLYVVLGLLIAPVAAFFIRLLYWQMDIWHHLKWSQPMKTAVAGLLVGVVAVFIPEVMGTGRDTMNQLLGQNILPMGIAMMLALAAGKMLATTISLGGGFVGGMFAPSLFVGAALGRAYGRLLLLVTNNQLSASPAAFAIAGMAAAMTGVIRAPITAVILLFELTNDYNLILPIMLTTVVCLFLVERLAPDGIYQLGLARKGFRVSRGRDIDVMQSILVKEAMSTQAQTVPAIMTASKLQAEFEKTFTHGLIVTDAKGGLYGIVTLQDFEKARESRSLDDLTVSEVCTRNVITITPNEPISTAFHLMAGRDLGRLPVVAANDPKQIVGILRRRDIGKAYEIALQRKLAGQLNTDQIKLAAAANTNILKLHVNAGSLADQHPIRDLPWPQGSIVASVWRNRETIVPRGDTLLQAGDILTVVTVPEREAELAKLVAKSGLSVF
jgi:CIC family chloride channel protein